LHPAVTAAGLIADYWRVAGFRVCEMAAARSPSMSWTLVGGDSQPQSPEG